MREEHPCGRCGRLTAHDDLRLHTTRERLREFARRAPLSTPRAKPARQVRAAEARITEPPGAILPGALADPLADGPMAETAEPAAPEPRGRAIAYRWVTHAHVLCPDCHALVQTSADRLHDHDRRRFVVMLILAVLLAGLIWLSFTTFLPNWIAAFWRNGAG